MNSLPLSSIPALLGLIYLLCIALVVYHISICIKDHWKYYDFTKAVEGTPFVGRIYFGILIIGWGSLVYMGAVGILLLIPDSFLPGLLSLSLKRVLAVTFAFLSLYILKVLDSYAINLVNRDVFEKEQNELEIIHDGLLYSWGQQPQTLVFLESKKSEYLKQAQNAQHDEYSFMYSGLVDRCDDYLLRTKKLKQDG
ncbi:MAG: hypothetical protein HQL68_04965 [Magnetococcales bacterium]|nr:hypothetical protein [Magnetococcales bacterium]